MPKSARQPQRSSSQPPAPPVQKPSESERYADVQRTVLQFCVLMAATLIASMLDFPSQLVTIIVAAGAVVFGTRALVALRALARKDGQTIMLYVGIAFCAVLGLGSLATLARTDVEMAYQDCRASAITEQAKLQCTIDYQKSMSEYFKQLR